MKLKFKSYLQLLHSDCPGKLGLVLWLPEPLVDAHGSVPLSSLCGRASLSLNQAWRDIALIPWPANLKHRLYCYHDLVLDKENTR